MAQIWPKRTIFEFSQKIRKSLFSDSKDQAQYKKLANSNGQRKNAKNLHFWAFWAKMANFGQFLAKMDKMGIFFKKVLGTIFSRLQALTNCKVSAKSNERFSSNRATDARTHVNPQVSNDFVQRPKRHKKMAKIVFEQSNYVFRQN